MSDLTHPAVRESRRSQSHGLRERIPLRSLFRSHLAGSGPTWIPLVLVLGAIVAVSYADHLVVPLSLIYLCILPIVVGATFLRRVISYGLTVVCVLLHDYYSPKGMNLGLRVFHNLTAMLCFALVVYVIRRYMEQREALATTVRQQRDDLLRDVELAAQVQRLFLPSAKPAIPGLEIAGMMHPARGVGGDYYDYFPVDARTTQIVVADVAGKGVPAALLMSATAAAMRFGANHDRNMLEQVQRLNTGILLASDDERYVTLLIAEIDTNRRMIRYVNCGHNPALLFRPSTGALTRLNSSCPPLGLSAEEICELVSADLSPGDVVVFYTDGVTEAGNGGGEEFGMERLSAAVRSGSSLSAEDLMSSIYNAAADFCGDDFNDDVTILVVKCDFDGSSTPIS
ncbi:MAG TPA: PP2C family protein-serine/threonine phosphatase [Candidatus Dormibacteraeota bacterium]|jgi:sigma-B regulation protein RsbU (phosphoserine phosphatase)|nr:PP2C family protein-serine/threonine phosphatase [Candidatus Dormibacteraeota bacterium]